MAIPMVSFCDIPLSQVKDHIQQYGRYALGLTKEWAKSRGISPVLYSYPDSLTSKAIFGIFRNLPILEDIQGLQGLTEAQANLLYFFLYIKRYEGHIYRNGAYLPENVRFYDEREWRFVPPIDVLSNGQVNAYLTKADFDNDNIRNAANQTIADKVRLSFRPKYIRYVIVSSEDEILEIMEAILQIKSAFPRDEVRLLTTRIISMDQILEDF